MFFVLRFGRNDPGFTQWRIKLSECKVSVISMSSLTRRTMLLSTVIRSAFYHSSHDPGRAYASSSTESALIFANVNLEIITLNHPLNPTTICTKFATLCTTAILSNSYSNVADVAAVDGSGGVLCKRLHKQVKLFKDKYSLPPCSRGICRNCRSSSRER